MLSKIKLAEFYELYKMNPDFSIEKLSHISGLSPLRIEEYIQKCDIIDSIHNHEEFTHERLIDYYEVIMIVYPNFIKFNQIIDTKIGRQLGSKKEFLSSQAENMELMPLTTFMECELKIADQMELDNNIRDFFVMFPYSTIKEAARAIKRTSQEIRIAAEQLRNNGEDIKFNNTPVIIEREHIAKEVIKLKTEEPALTIHEISRRLGIAISEVNMAIKNMIYVWKHEKADNYDFYLRKTSQSIDMVETEAWTQHENGGNRPSSRWLEIALMAIEKRIAIHGLKAPDKVDITQRDARSKEERDQIIDIAFEADELDVDPDRIQITGTQ